MNVHTRRLELRLLGGFALLHHVSEVAVAPRSERLLAFLALRDRVPRDTVAFRLWPDATEAQAHACLRSTLWRLPKPGGQSLVSGDVGRIYLNKALVTDVQRLQAVAKAWAPSTPPPDGVRTLAFRSDLLPSWYDDWLIIERERHRQLRLHTLERLSSWHSAQAAYHDAIEAGLHALAGDPLRESAHRCLIRAHLGEGNLSEAIRQTRTYLALLTEAGLPARLSPQMEALVRGYDGWSLGSTPRPLAGKPANHRAATS